MPKTNRPYWRDKIARNRARDEAHLTALDALGWRALVVYECELKDIGGVRAKLAAALAC